jgi:hypothetical protein
VLVAPSQKVYLSRQQTTAPWLSAWSSKSFYSENSSHSLKSSNATTALTMMATQSKQPLAVNDNIVNLLPQISDTKTPSAKMPCAKTPSFYIDSNTASSSATSIFQEVVPGLTIQRTRMHPTVTSDKVEETQATAFSVDGTPHGDDDQDTDLALGSSQGNEVVPCSYVREFHSSDHVVENSNGGPPKWEDIPPDFIIKRCKLVPYDVMKSFGCQDFYKSYTSGGKMTQDQKNKSLAWFSSTPNDLQGMFYFF